MKTVELEVRKIHNELYRVTVPDDIANEEEAVYQYAIDHDVEPSIIKDTELEFITE